jgi:hypothetical protein
MKHVRYFACLATLLLALSVIAFQGTATSPRYIKLQYNPTAHTLKVTVMHFSPAKKIHYVYRIEIDRNGQVAQAYLYQSQPRFLLFSYTYNITLNPGDFIIVSAYCILWGNIQKSQTITNSVTIT